MHYGFVDLYTACPAILAGMRGSEVKASGRTRCHRCY